MFDKKKVKLGIAPIAWTNDDMPDLGSENTFEQCVSEMALAGFTGSEVGNKYPKDTKVLKHALDLRGVEICNQWFSAFLITKPFEEVEKEFLTVIKIMPTLVGLMVAVPCTACILKRNGSKSDRSFRAELQRTGHA